ncbi:NAD-dependent epimerase/dehydratase family protein [Romboutsia lituseburensis]|uniref:NAD-dependent epimerase/dehydratase family protein n=1 Tax=Romboutsia lituseburensis TaxID=1537 RepID=UPI00215A2985|nr:NAD-dependent epimerase/dehydratase family protein [Romboutsia lituseburensis]MCR8746704.1 NAD-dependent epimerase/dehydratase family protein [Romboutsia lituseburensis]
MNKIIEEDIKYIINNIPVKEFEGKSVMITGANGFISGYIVETLCYINENILDDKCKIVALCRNELKAKAKFKNYLNKQYFNLLIQDVKETIEYDDKIDYIFHAASIANTREFGINPVGVIGANAIGTYNLLEYANKKDVEGFVFFSSGAIYGNLDSAKDFITENQSFGLDPLDIRNCYSESKRMGENMCYSYHKQFNIPTKIVRIGHTYGPGIDINDGRVFSDFAKSILDNEALIIKSDGTSKRAFCYISDAIIGFFLVLLNGNNGEAYNLTNNDYFISISELAEILVNEVFYNKKLDIIYYSDPNEKDLRSKTKGCVSLNIEKIKKLGWNPKISIEEGFRRTIDSFSGGEN